MFSRTLEIRRSEFFSSSLSIFNGVGQGSVLSPHLFAVYFDDLFSELYWMKFGWCIGNICFNHSMFADDIQPYVALLLPQKVCNNGS